MSGIRVDLSGKVALVTGGAGGLGKGSVMALAQAGADIVIADINTEQADQTVASVKALGRNAISIPTNMMEIDQIEPLVESAVSQMGRIDILVNNVGGGRPTAFLQQSTNSISRHINLNLMSVLIATQLVAPIMIKAGNGGAIVNVASTEALRAAPGFAVYAACKAAMVSFTKTMALELAEHNIRSFALAPDMILTPGLAPLMNAASEKQQAARDRYIPSGRMGSIEEFGHVVAFLASGLASYLNGVTVPVDAGATAAAGWYRDPVNQWCLYHGEAES